MDALSVTQFDLVYNILSFTVAAMGGATMFFFLQRGELLPKYRVVATLAGVVTMIAAYNYWGLLNSWAASYVDVNGTVKATNHLYNETYRYADWLLTVPILMVNLVLVIDLPRRAAQVRGFVLALQAVEMILLGYPGQLTKDPTTRWLWWGAGMIPFGIIVYQLYGTLAGAVRAQPEGARHLVIAARFLTVLVWCVYPVIYLLPLFGITGTEAFVFTQVGYAAADITAKAGYGVLLYMIAYRKSIGDEAQQAPHATRLRQAA